MDATRIGKKLESYQIIAEIFTEIGDMRTVKTACDLGLSLNPLSGVLKFYSGLSYYKKGLHKKSTQYFTDIIDGKNIITDDKLKMLFEKYHIPFDSEFMTSLNEVNTKIRSDKITMIVFLLISTIAVGICIKFFG